ncbi:MAG: class I SAM-dependent methyltransferase [Gammaproteobacteria bacterium]|nr:class I SAM-dependent methyltransferase [Gammaproteobacteria bacterium]
MNHNSNTSFNLTCPLCQISEGIPFFKDRRNYFQCPECSLVFVPPQQYISTKEEKSMYDLHENSADDPGYRQFLNRFLIPFLTHIKPNSHGLDFGSGPGPTLSIMLKENGHSVVNYDCFYAPDINLLESCSAEKAYDFITATEVVEHLHHPKKELERLWSCLKPNGSLGIMTKRVLNQKAFTHWHYKNDITHVCFFALETFQWLAKHWNATLTTPEKDVVIFTKGRK